MPGTPTCSRRRTQVWPNPQFETGKDTSLVACCCAMPLMSNCYNQSCQSERFGPLLRSKLSEEGGRQWRNKERSGLLPGDRGAGESGAILPRRPGQPAAAEGVHRLGQAGVDARRCVDYCRATSADCFLPLVLHIGGNSGLHYADMLRLHSPYCGCQQQAYR